MLTSSRGVVLDVVLGGALDLAGVLDDDDARQRLDGDDMVDDGIDQGGLARAGAAETRMLERAATAAWIRSHCASVMMPAST